MIDPITVAVLQNRLNAIAEEMGEAMLRTAYSQILNSSRDFSIALIDAQCRLVAQADHIPVHVGAMSWAAKALMEAVPDPEPNAVYLLNDPYRGGSHLPDLTIFVPVFAADQPAFLVGCPRPSLRYRRRHAWRLQPGRHGNLAGGSSHPADAADRKRRAARRSAADVGAERAPSAGLPWRPRGADRRRSAWRATPCSLSSPKFGADTLPAAVEAMLDAAERHARAIVSSWADGVYDGEALLDDDGFDRNDIGIRARVTKVGSDVTVDLTGSIPRSPGFVNSSHANMQSAVTMAFAFLLDPDIRHE